MFAQGFALFFRLVVVRLAASYSFGLQSLDHSARTRAFVPYIASPFERTITSKEPGAARPIRDQRQRGRLGFDCCRIGVQDEPRLG